MSIMHLHIFRGRPKMHVAMFPAVYCCDYLASDQSMEEYGDKVSSLVYCFTPEDIIATINTQEDYERMGNRLVDEYFSRPKYLENIIKWAETKRNLLADCIEENLGKSIIYDLSNEEIAKRYIAYAELYREYNLKNTPTWWIGSEALQMRVEKYLKETGIKSADAVISRLSDAVEYSTENLEEEFSLLEIAKDLQESGIGEIDEKKLQSMPSIESKLDHHVKNFSSIPFGYKTGVIWDKSYFIDKINEVLKNPNAGRLIESKNLEIQRNNEQQKAVSSSLNLPDKVREQFKQLRQLAYLQELKKTTQTRSHPILQLVVKGEIARRLGVTVTHIDYMSHEEVSECLLRNEISKDLLFHIEERLKYAVLIMKDLKYEWLIGAEAEEFFKLNDIIQKTDSNIRELKGSPGSKGFAKGVVKVVLFSTEILKIKEGDILVTAMTTPDFISAMRRASAIITDEGGITCHAAIISREMNKPCIIGTKIATKVLKDGDVVEVDANKGIVKIVKKA